MAECKRCGKTAYTCRDEFFTDWERSYCSEECWKSSDGYVHRRLAFIKFFKSLTYEQRQPFIELLSSIGGDYCLEEYKDKYDDDKKKYVEKAYGELWNWILEARKQVEEEKEATKYETLLKLKKEFKEVE